ncbi:MAG: biotin--[acetyl-CoA-carboxylase] ligase [Oscillospiraceae bacterium]|jgi:BirA family biotin operon repressor/biotin-[acetyl-CoA-carboxylase] ligase|nr:biotin--[acetyl-CoA-carboxylase] ligase [Oscillospiraceae bacterium]
MNTKNKILALLESNRSKSISGEFIAGQLGVSRNAVWKAINELKKDGYKIKAVTNKGYLLCDDNDILSVQGMLPFLTEKSISKQIFVHDVLESTNKTAKEMAVSGAEHGTVITANHQTTGKGRYGRAFYSPPDSGIYMSFILHPAELYFNTPTLITAFAAVSVCEAIEAVSSLTPRIKWVNDVFIDSKKICGILTEAITDFESGNTQWAVVGIGINFNTSDFPEDLQETAGALFGEKTPVTRNRLCAELINRIINPENHSEKEMLGKYKQRMYMLGKRVTVTGISETYEAVALDVDETGRLVVRKADGEQLSLSAGEISVKV